MTVSIIVAAADNGVIGHKNELPWRLSTDLRRFKRLTMGHHLIMGRKTFDTVGRPLPGRTIVVISRSLERAPDGILLARSLDQALHLAAGDDEVFIAGGGEIYRLALPLADRIYLTRVHANPEGDTWFPEVDETAWHLQSRQDHEADNKNQYRFSFLDYARK
jgi:dihydrofolate reductase